MSTVVSFLRTLLIYIRGRYTGDKQVVVSIKTYVVWDVDYVLTGYLSNEK